MLLAAHFAPWSVRTASLNSWIHSGTVDRLLHDTEESPDILASCRACQPAICLTRSKETPRWAVWNRAIPYVFSLEVKEDVREVANWLYATSAKYPVTRFRCWMQFSCYCSACDVTLLPHCLITSWYRSLVSHSLLCDGRRILPCKGLTQSRVLEEQRRGKW